MGKADMYHSVLNCFSGAEHLQNVYQQSVSTESRLLPETLHVN